NQRQGALPGTGRRWRGRHLQGAVPGIGERTRHRTRDLVVRRPELRSDGSRLTQEARLTGLEPSATWRLCLSGFPARQAEDQIRQPVQVTTDLGVGALDPLGLE